MRSIGSAYLCRQSPGSERLGGLQIVIRPPKSAVGTITVTRTGFWTDTLEPIPDDCVEKAIIGIREVAEKVGISLNDLDVELSRFMFHEVDSHSQCYYQAAKSAFRAALEMWSLKDLGS